MTFATVGEILARRGVAHTLHIHRHVRNAAEASRAGLGFDLSLLVKTLVFRDPERWLLAVLRAGDQVAYGALARAAGTDRRRLRLASEEELCSEFGWEPGGATPVTERPQALILVDHAVCGMPRIFFGGGTPTLTIEAETAALLAAVPHRRASFAK